MECVQHFLWPSDPLLVDLKDCPGTDGGKISFRKGVQPGAWLIHIQTRYAVQPVVVQVIQYKGIRWISDWRDPTTQGNPGVCGTGAIHSNLLCTAVGRTASHMWGRQRVLPFLRFPEEEWHPTWKSESRLAYWLHHWGQLIPQEQPTDSVPPWQVQQDSCAKDNSVWRNGIFARR